MSIYGEQWRDAAACVELGTAMFFEEGESGLLSKQPAQPTISRICESCAVRKECLEFALANNEKYGIWGGLTPYQRKLLRRRKILQQTPATEAEVERVGV